MLQLSKHITIIICTKINKICNMLYFVMIFTNASVIMKNFTETHEKKTKLQEYGYKKIIKENVLL